MDGLTINKENLKFHKFKRYGITKWGKSFQDTGVLMLVDIKSDKPHVSIEMGNDSLHVTNCNTIKDLFDLDRLFGTYSTEV